MTVLQYNKHLKKKKIKEKIINSEISCIKKDKYMKKLELQINC